jgi:hypothetical protein
MEFRLTYEGPLKAATSQNSRAKHKHEIRKLFHKQLVELWSRYPPLAAMKTNHEWDQERGMPGTGMGPPEIESIGIRFERCGYRFVPLITREKALCCDLDILFLRRENPGALFHGGDLDNRLKVLFDALRIPGNCDELGGYSVAPDEVPYFYCLLSDDQLITGISIKTDRFLKPLEGGRGENDVHLIIGVTVKATEVGIDNLALVS